MSGMTLDGDSLQLLREAKANEIYKSNAECYRFGVCIP